MNGSWESEELSTSLIEKNKCQDTRYANSEDSDEEKVTTQHKADNCKRKTKN
jgi:hypothetical protein